MFRTSASKSIKIQKIDSIWNFPIDFDMFTHVMSMISNTKMNILSIETKGKDPHHQESKCMAPIITRGGNLGFNFRRSLHELKSICLFS